MLCLLSFYSVIACCLSIFLRRVVCGPENRPTNHTPEASFRRGHKSILYRCAAAIQLEFSVCVAEECHDSPAMAGAQLIAPVEDIKHKRIQGVDDGTKQLKMVEYSNIPKAIKKETKNKAYFIRDLSKRFLENFNAYCILSFFSII